LVVYPFIRGATMEKDYDYVLHGNKWVYLSFSTHFWANVEMFDYFLWIRFKGLFGS
jgi:hypothetical protein